MRPHKNIFDAVHWIRTNQEKFWGVIGGIVLIGVFLALVIRRHETESREAWIQLGNIQSQLMQDQFQEAAKSFETWEPRFKGTDAGTYGKFLKADLLYKTSRYAEASVLYGELSESGKPDVVRPLALSAKASTEEMLGHIPEAIALGKAFVEKHPDHFLAAERYLANARLLELNQDPLGAATVYDRFILLFPQSPWNAMARDRVQKLRQGSSSAPAAAPVTPK